MIKTVLFDVDGVLLSEDHYFDASALTVWEMLISGNYLALDSKRFKTDIRPDEIKAIRQLVFGEHDEILKFMKTRGLNANWDMIYLVFGHQLIHLLSQVKENEKERIFKWCQAPINRETLLEIGQVLSMYAVTIDFSIFVKEFSRTQATKQELLGYLNDLVMEKLGVRTDIFKEKDELWSVCEHASQEWYVGDENILASTGKPSVQTGKKGFLAFETTLAPKEEIKELFQYLAASGYQIGIGTGRPRLETIQPFKHLGWMEQFDGNRIITADEVLKAERVLPEQGKSLSKPHPYTYIAALLGREAIPETCLNMPLPLENSHEVLIVGDSLADLFAARSIGCPFAAVLTGLSGKDARSEFEEYQADFIFDSVLGVKDILK